jgi:RNA polymerase sigma-70 factor (ECF subfamily)
VSDETDVQLVKNYLEGDETSFEILVKKYLRPIYGYAVGIVGREEADDVVQEAFLRVWRHLSTFDTQRVFKTWLYRIAHNAALDLLKKKRPTAFSELDQIEESPTMEEMIKDDSDPISELLDQRDSADQLRKALDALPIPQRSVLTLHYLDGLTYAEIGQTLDEPLDTVKSRSRRALVSLKKILEKSKI